MQQQQHLAKAICVKFSIPCFVLTERLATYVEGILPEQVIRKIDDPKSPLTHHCQVDEIDINRLLVSLAGMCQRNSQCDLPQPIVQFTFCH